MMTHHQRLAFDLRMAQNMNIQASPKASIADYWRPRLLEDILTPM